MKNLLLQPRRYRLLVLFATVALIIIGFVLSYQLGIPACSLCVLQRICYGVIALVCLIASLHRHHQRIVATIYDSIHLLFAMAGCALAWRQLYLQAHPELAEQCLPGLSYLLDTLPLGQAFVMAIKGASDCAEVHWHFLGLNIAQWSLLCFAILLIAQLIFMLSVKKKSDRSLRDL